MQLQGGWKFVHSFINVVADTKFSNRLASVIITSYSQTYTNAAMNNSSYIVVVPFVCDLYLCACQAQHYHELHTSKHQHTFVEELLLQASCNPAEHHPMSMKHILTLAKQ